jgi:UDP-N-acetylmuramyl tripeptide synthase
MLLAGILGRYGVLETADMINSFSNLTEKKISIIDSAILTELTIATMRSYIRELEKNGIEILVLKINIEDVAKKTFSALHFDIIIYTDKVDNGKGTYLNNYSEILFEVFSLLDKKAIVIVNVDDTKLISFLQGMECYIVTYGFNKKASITASSTGDSVYKDNFMCCLQRTISTKQGQLVEPQEYVISMEIENSDPYNILAAAAFAIVNGIDLNISSFSNVK